MPRKIEVGSEINPFLDSISALFEEQQARGLKSSGDFKLLRAQLSSFLESCTKYGVNKARAKHSFLFANGTKPDTEVLRPPSWMKINANEKAQILRTSKRSTFVNALRDILNRQGKANKKALDTSFSDSSPSPEPRSRKRRSKEDDRDYEPPPPKKAKTQKPIQEVHQPSSSRKIKAVLTSSGWSTTGPSRERQKGHGENTQKTLNWKVTKNKNKADKGKDTKSFGDAKQSIVKTEISTQETPGQPPTFPILSPPTAIRIPSFAAASKAYPGLAPSLPSSLSPKRPRCQKFEYEDSDSPEPHKDTVADRPSAHGDATELSKAVTSYERPAPQAATSKIESEDAGSHLTLSTSVFSHTPLLPRLAEQAADPSPKSSTQHSQTYRLRIDDTDSDTDSESESLAGDDSVLKVSSVHHSKTEASADYWPSAPKTSKSGPVLSLHSLASPFPLRIDNPVQRLWSGIEIYKGQISHIPRSVWNKYNKKLEKFCQDAAFDSTPFIDRFGCFRRIVYLEEEDAAMYTNDWERLRRAARICGLLAEITAPQGEDAKSLVERELSINIRDINWLEKKLGDKRAL